MTILLVDRKRNFVDGRVALVARTSDEAIALNHGVEKLDQLWLDYMLDGMDSSGDFLLHLLKMNAKLDVKEVYLYADSWGGVELMQLTLKRLGVKKDCIQIVDPTTHLIG